MPRLPNSPLYGLIRTGDKLRWGEDEDSAFCIARGTLCQYNRRPRQDTKKPLILECDASPRQIGAVLSHPCEDSVKPVRVSSRILPNAKMN